MGTPKTFLEGLMSHIIVFHPVGLLKASESGQTTMHLGLVDVTPLTPRFADNTSSQTGNQWNPLACFATLPFGFHSLFTVQLMRFHSREPLGDPNRQPQQVPSHLQPVRSGVPMGDPHLSTIFYYHGLVFSPHDPPAGQGWCGLLAEVAP